MPSPSDRIAIDDFSPGIFSEEPYRTVLKGDADESLGNNPMLGAASVDGTWGCTVDQTGALVPLPARTLEESSPGVNPDAVAHTFIDDGVTDTPANYLLGAAFGPGMGDFGARQAGLPFGKYDVLLPDRAPFQTLYTVWGVTIRDPGNPSNVATATHGWYKFRQQRIVDDLGEYHTFYWFTEDMWGDGESDGSVLPRVFPFAGLVQMRTHTWGKPDYGTRWPMFNPGTFVRTMVALIEGVRVVGTDNCGDCELHPPFIPSTFYYRDADAVGEDWFYPGGSWPTCSWPDPNFPWTTDSHMSILAHNNAIFPGYGGNWPGAHIWSQYSGDADGTPVRGGWSAHFRDQSIASFFKAMPFRVRHAVHHQGRLVMVSRIESYAADELLLYSDWLAPLNYMDETKSNEQRWGWDNKFFPPVSSDFPNISVRWKVNNTAANAPTTEAFFPEYTSTRPYTVMLPGDDSLENTCSMGTAPDGQLFLIKSHGGAVLISGDLDNPTVKVAPNVEPTYGVESTGVHTPLGYVYGSRTGVYAWGGGEESQKLSPQLSGFFWDHALPAETDRYLGPRGNFEYWDDKILAPNDYLLNLTSRSWWRLEPRDPNHDDTRTPYNRYAVEMDGRLWAFAYRVTAENTDFAYSYDTATPRDTYSWRSMPIIADRDNLVACEDIELVVTPTTGCEVDVTIEGWTYTARAGDQDHLGAEKITRTVAFTFPAATIDDAIAANRPLKLRRDIPDNFNATQVTVRVEASGDTVAPTIHSAAVGTGKRTRIPRLGGKAF